jgi:hypothetical protein
VSLHRSIQRLGEELAWYYAEGGLGTPPFLVYVYQPKEEFRVRADLQDLKAWLEAEPRSIRCVAISLSDLLWRALDESGYWEELVATERCSPEDPRTLRLVHTSITQILSGPPSLADRIIDNLAGVPTPAAAFLYRAGALFPAYRTSAILEDLRDRLPLPVALLYPGTLQGTYGLSFMGRCSPAHSYRAKIIPRDAG